MCQNKGIYFFNSDIFVRGGHIGGYFEKKVDEAAPGTEQILHREDHVKICPHLGVGNTQYSGKVSRIYSQWTLTSIKVCVRLRHSIL